MIRDLKAKLKELDFSDNEMAVYIALTRLGEAPAAAVAKKAGLPRTTAISLLNKLAEENYLTTHTYHGTTYFWVESPRAIVVSLEHKLEIAGKLNELLTGLYRTEANFPYAQVFDTKLSIKKFIEKLLAGLKRRDIIYTIDTPVMGNYAKIFADDTNGVIAREKKKKDILTRTLVPFGSYASIKPEKLKGLNLEIRELPREINFKASLWIVGDLVVLFSGNPPFLVAIRHELITASLIGIVSFLWTGGEVKK